MTWEGDNTVTHNLITSPPNEVTNIGALLLNHGYDVLSVDMVAGHLMEGETNMQLLFEGNCGILLPYNSYLTVLTLILWGEESLPLAYPITRENLQLRCLFLN